MRSAMTAAELEYIRRPGEVTELVRGRLVVREPPGTKHGRIAANLGYFLSDFVRRHRSGVVLAQDTGFRIEADPDTVRAPDVAFVRQERVAEIPERGYAAVAPDLLAEIVSPGDAAPEAMEKVAAWLRAGTRLVWVIDPARAEARVHRADGTISIVAADGVLNGEGVLPGFTCALADVLN
jgi:Uma2 family endonuclease